jgi:DnaK suppressor protein
MEVNMKKSTTTSYAQTTEMCRKKLLEHKEFIINQLKTLQTDFNLIEKSRGDESDLSFAHQEEHQFLVTQNRVKRQLIEIDYALSRIENNSFGFCEITGEPIEDSRLLALPWTRYSVEGAEIFEAQNQKSNYAG